MAFTAIYCHPLEHTLCNIMSVLLGPMLLGSHGILWCCWVFLALYNTCNAHGCVTCTFSFSPPVWRGGQGRVEREKERKREREREKRRRERREERGERERRKNEEKRLNEKRVRQNRK